MVKINSILNSSAEDRVCFISIDFDTFILTRFWNLDENFESLIVELKSSKKRFKDYEAEEYIREKFPLELGDFIFLMVRLREVSIISIKKDKKVFEVNHFGPLGLFVIIKPILPGWLPEKKRLGLTKVIGVTQERVREG